jgi:DNA-binding response OmpR family regulator
MSFNKILLVEDDENLGQILQEYLQMKQYEVSLCRNGEEGLKQFKTNTYHLVILDVMMPKKDGFTLAGDIKKTNPHVPFIFLTAKSMQEDTLKGLKLGADDYITKPFSMEELLLRLKAILKRTYQEKDNKAGKYKLGSCSFDADAHLLETPEQKIKLTTKEAELLRLLCLNMNQCLNRGDALKAIWHDDSYFNARSMDVYITKLRKYLKVEPAIKILTLHGQGFKLLQED